MKTVVGKHSRRKVLGTLTPLGLVAVGWLGMGVVPGAAVPTAAPAQQSGQGVLAPAAPITEQAPTTAQQVGQADANDLSLAASTRTALVTTASVTDIPAKSLAAYQRAAMVIDSSDTTCHLDWTLLAAIGKVESDNGRTKHTANGIFGLALNGKHHTAKVRDTDGGKLDGNTKWDRAVGPMQLLPSTWAIVGVDGNGDGTRDPQSIADSALGAAVYLCGTDEDLATKAGQREAAGRYNHSASYIKLVMAISQAYAASRPAADALLAPHTTAIPSIPLGSVGSIASTTTTTTKKSGAGSTPVAKSKPGHPTQPVKPPKGQGGTGSGSGSGSGGAPVGTGGTGPATPPPSPSPTDPPSGTGSTTGTETPSPEPDLETCTLNDDGTMTDPDTQKVYAADASDITCDPTDAQPAPATASGSTEG